jgi:Domain of unknown function (DUF4412)
MLKLISLTLTLCLMLTMPSHAGIRMVQSYQKLGEKTEPTSNTIYIDKAGVRIETGRTPDQYFIYRSDKKVFVTVNLKEKSYMEITEKEFTEMFSKMDEAKKRMQEQMANMPPAQKEMMEKMMAKMMPAGGNGTKTVFKKMGSGGTINGWTTVKYEGINEGIKQSEIWTTDPKSLDIGASDYQVLKDMAKFFEKFAKNMEGLVGDKAHNGMDGIPIKSISFKEGIAEFQTELKEAKRENFANSLFEIPAGLTKKQMGKPN